MSDVTFPSVDAAYKELDAVVGRLERTATHERDLIVRRNAIFAWLLGQNEVQAHIAKRAKVSTTTVGLGAGKTYVRSST